MPIKINHNIFSTIVQRNLNRTNGRLMQSFERLSTGERINRSADDPAGLATSDQIRYELRAVRKDQQNVGGAFGLIGTAESQLAVIGDNIQRARELVVQGANDTLNANDRQAIQGLYQLVQEKDAQIEALKARLAAVEEALDQRDGPPLISPAQPDHSKGAAGP